MASRTLLGLVCALSFAQATLADDDFPSTGWLPKAETGALRLLEKHPEYDGRGVVVAIFDTGVDPGVDGLQTTSDGRPKIVDLVDGSGSGDVDTSETRQAEDGVLLGATGRQLRIPDEWKNPTGDFHVGWKRAYELYPADLISRVKTHRRREWDEQQRRLASQLREVLTAFDAEHPAAKRTEEQKRERKELADRISLLTEVQKSYDDPGPIFDCVVFHDGERWQAVLDTDEDGELSDEAVMTNFREFRQFAQFDAVSLLNFAVNIYDEGELLSIVTDCGSHGTHVAGIVAAHYPDQPERNGLAPGAQIVSVKIGDRRLGSSSTGVGQMRGMAAVLRNGCDLINMSYGGATSDPNSGRMLQRYAEFLREHKILFVASAGNNGPALSTVGSPGGTSSALLGVGAYVSPELMRSAYAQREARVEQAFTWTSRGPAADGDLGVDICAPGGAVSPVAQWTLRHRRLANGTSMSSPNACGNIALLLSALKARELPISPTSVRRAVVNTARPLAESDPFAHGQGLIQIDKALDYALTRKDATYSAMRFDVTFGDGLRGLYLRDASQLRTPLNAQVSVNPAAPRYVSSLNKSKLDVNVRLVATADWVEAPEQMVLTYGGKSFAIRVDPSPLPPGAHYAEVQGFDADRPELGPLFRAPITVVQPHRQPRETEDLQESLPLQAGKEHRRFLQAPDGAAWIDVELRADAANDGNRRYVIHALQLTPARSIGRGFQREYVTLTPGQQIVRRYPVIPGHTLELCLAQFWSSLGPSRLEMKTRFRGLRPSPDSLGLSNDSVAERCEVFASLGDHDLKPSGELTTLRRTLPVDAFEVRTLSGPRDSLPEARRAFESITTYRFELKELRQVQPRPVVSSIPELYLSWESGVWQIFDVNKRLAASGKGARNPPKLPKGDYVLRFHLRHESPESLEQWKHAPLQLDLRLAKPVPLKIFADPDDAIAGKPTFGSRRVREGERAVLYVRPDKLPGSLQIGDALLGSLHFASKDNAAGIAGRPGGFPVVCHVHASPSASKAKDESNDASPGKSTTKDEEPPWLLAAQRARLAELRERGDHEAFETLLKTVLAEHPDDLPTLVEHLKLLDDDDRKQRLPEIVAAANKILARIPRKKLAKHFGVRIDPDDEAQVAERKKRTEQRAQLVDTLYRKGRAIAYMDLPPVPGAPPMEIPKKPATKEARAKLFERNYRELQRWVDMTEPTYVLLNVRRERRHGRHAAALRLLDDLLKEQPTRALLHKKRGDLFGELGWTHWQAYEKAWKIIRFPAAYPPF